MGWKFWGRKPEAKATDVSALAWDALYGAPMVKSGVAVNTHSALRVSTVLACARVLAEGVAQLPLKLYSETEDGARTPIRNHSLYRVLARRPNDWMTSYEFRETMTMHAVIEGNAYAYIGRVGNEVRELIPLIPGCVQVEQSPDYDLTYRVSDLRGSYATLPRTSILHLRGPSWDSYTGMVAIRQAREAIGLAIATEETHARLHSNGARPGGIISVKNTLSAEAVNNLRAAWNAAQAGVSNAFKTAIMDQGAEWHPMSPSGVDNQHLETRRYQVEEICRAMRVFPQMVGYSDKTATYASAEQFFLAHVIHSLMPWIRRWEEVIDRDLLDSDGDMVARFNVKGLLRGAAADRANYFSKALGAGGSPAWMTQDEVRAAEEDLNPMGGSAAVLPVATNVAPAGGATQPQEGGNGAV